jgi:hypothetical protein
MMVKLQITDHKLQIKQGDRIAGAVCDARTSCVRTYKYGHIRVRTAGSLPLAITIKTQP